MLPVEFVADLELDSKAHSDQPALEMDREFLDLYNRELLLLHEQAREFAEEYPGIAERLGGLVAERTDPMIAGLLEGTAFLAARVQLKLKHEFPEFTNNLLEQLIPNYLAPTPSAMLAKVLPPYSDAKAAGRIFDPARLLSRRYLSRARTPDRLPLLSQQRHRGCGRSTSPAPNTTPTPGPLQALGLSVGHEVLAGLRISLTHRIAARIEDEMSELESRKHPETWFAGCRTAEPADLSARRRSPTPSLYTSR